MREAADADDDDDGDEYNDSDYDGQPTMSPQHKQTHIG